MELQLPLTLEEGGGGLGGSLGGWGSKQPPLHLAAGSWDTGQEGPICHLQFCQLLRAGWAGVGDGERGTAVWPRSFQAKMGMRDHFRRVVICFLEFFVFFFFAFFFFFFIIIVA